MPAVSMTDVGGRKRQVLMGVVTDVGDTGLIKEPMDLVALVLETYTDPRVMDA